METLTKKKVNYLVMSNKTCKVCNRPLKQNVVSRNKHADKCFVCTQIAKGKTELTEMKRDQHGNIVSIKVRNLKELQAKNIKKYKNEKQN